MTSPRFTGGVNIAMKIPAADYERTVAFYRDTLRMELEEVADTGAPTVSRSHTVDFGPCEPARRVARAAHRRPRTGRERP